MSLATSGNKAILAVENDGPPLPEAMVTRLFDSMVSLREPEVPRTEAHLGLGLYIVRLVAEFHQGTVRAMNLSGRRGSAIRSRGAIALKSSAWPASCCSIVIALADRRVVPRLLPLVHAPGRPEAKSKDVEDMVACARCGVNMPRSEAVAEGDAYHCKDNPRCRP